MKKTNRKRVFIGLTILSVGALATTAAFAIRGMHGPRFVQRVYERVKEKLKLTPAQARKVDALKDRVVARFKKARDTRRGWFAAAKQLWLDDRIDEAKLQALIRRVEGKHKAHKRFALSSIRELHGILTAKQRQELVSLVEKFRGKMRKRFGRWRGHR